MHRILKACFPLLVGACLGGNFHPARADEQIRPLVITGDWMAAEHAVSMTEAPDLCIAGNNREGLLFRAASTSLELRIVDEAWSLPTEVQGKVGVQVGAKSYDFTITSNTSQMVSADMEPAVALDLFHVMDNNAEMTITAGHSKARHVSLHGSTKAMNAFRTCAGLHSSGVGGGDNPFSSPGDAAPPK